ncbi:(d)CMP kinase [Luteithermobacter gelatinilyticus]|uniref:(d)CMP kinase n=1 Tax=Luteithermobacter gelatinilyticus TaxID=2582913 RepID=UPI001106616F|nr:(d)CMP kinase [Luteithermobacter gelatinilyticus]
MTAPAKSITVIAIDGPAASGKGTLARRLAAHFDYAHLDTGALYRAVGLGVLRAGGNPEDEADAVRAAEHVAEIDLDDPALRSESTGAAASKVAAIPEVRRILLDYQRQFAATPPGNKRGAVLDGRDIGTVVCPDATHKFFITADVETRAKRRFLELFGEQGTAEQYARILEELRLRDERDMTRATAPLKPAENAHLLDTTNSDIEAVFEKALSLIRG